MTDSKIDLSSWSRFLTRDLIVSPELLGLACEFQFEKGQIRIEIPTADNLTDSEDNDSALKIFSYKVKNGRKIPVAIAVRFVDVLVCLNRKVNLPKEVLTRHPNPIALLSREQQKLLDELTTAHYDVASRAFDLWVKTLRWKSGKGAIGRPEVHGFESGWSTYLLDNTTKWRFWATPLTLSVILHKPVTLSEWNEAEKALQLGQKSPVYIDLMFDGIEQFKLGDLQRSVVDLAVACESYMRARVMQNLPGGLTNAVLNYIDEAPIQRVLDKFFAETLSDEQNRRLESIRSTLHQLFDARNDILHSGRKEDLSSADCKKYIEATKKLIAIE
jgi:hypothetical protein